MNLREKRNSDSGRSPSDDEKQVGDSGGAFQKPGHSDLPPDPDANLSPEEKAKIVRVQEMTRG